MKSLCDLCVVVPSDNMQIIEDLHLSIAHSVFRVLRHEIQAMDHSRATIALAQPVSGHAPSCLPRLAAQ